MEQSIKIRIADREYPLKVSSPEHEEVIRKAAADINKRLSLYQDKYPGKSMVEILSFVALNVSMTNITLQGKIREMSEDEERLAKELEGYLDNIDKNSR
ncbi:MAG: cell division protein ZapA [Bacteroidales bacterium]|nr:cell division protein ZapA [Bacteroidales bacterium]MBQ6689984.1 cell division protein ZapA [Bacteroidales bacterium]